MSNRDIEIIAFPFYFFVNCLREVRNISKMMKGIVLAEGSGTRFIQSQKSLASNCYQFIMQKLTAEKESLSVVFDQVGTPTYAHDLANGIYIIMQKDDFEKKSNISLFE